MGLARIDNARRSGRPRKISDLIDDPLTDIAMEIVAHGKRAIGVPMTARAAVIQSPSASSIPFDLIAPSWRDRSREGAPLSGAPGTRS